jgi:hypothetical protein
MIGAVLPPTPGDVVLGIAAVIVGALIAATAAFLARRTRNWLLHLDTAGGLLIVAGVVGQRTPGVGTALGPWDAGITIPVLGVRIDPVAAAGIVVTLIGLVLTLLLERVPQPGEGPGPLVHRPLDEDDAI